MPVLNTDKDRQRALALLETAEWALQQKYGVATTPAMVLEFAKAVAQLQIGQMIEDYVR
jgi:hypothetical protein